MKNQEIITLLESFGVEKTLDIRELSENSYKIVIAANGEESIWITDDVDIEGVFETSKPEGVKVTHSNHSTGFGRQEFPIKKLSL